MKKRIKLEEILEVPDEVIKTIEEDGILEFFDHNKIKDVEEWIDGSEYTVAEIELLGKKYGVIMKDSLANALLDPQAGSANILREAGRKVLEKLVSAYGKRQIKPLETNVEKTIFKNYVSSLLMNLVKYPTDELNEETLRDLGLYDEKIRKLYVRAAAAWLGSVKETEKIINAKGIISKLEKVGFTGKKEEVDLSIDTCRKESHYVLKPVINKKQINVQMEVPKISEQYIEIEDKIVDYIIKNSSNPIIRNNARNLVRLYLNITSFYDKNKPLPLEWGS
ncbi:MAG: hypothetical protein QXL88_02220 [Candidatus Pacearchaeota archaeon]